MLHPKNQPTPCGAHMCRRRSRRALLAGTLSPNLCANLFGRRLRRALRTQRRLALSAPGARLRACAEDSVFGTELVAALAPAFTTSSQGSSRLRTGRSMDEKVKPSRTRAGTT